MKEVVPREKLELDKIRASQQLARTERDQWFTQSRDAKTDEDRVRGDLAGLNEKIDQCRQQIGQLRSEQRMLEDQFSAEENSYRRYLSEKRLAQKKKTEFERAEAARLQQEEQAEILATCEPLLYERQLCSALIRYTIN